jgi:hypothetical protein
MHADAVGAPAATVEVGAMAELVEGLTRDFEIHDIDNGPVSWLTLRRRA